VITPGPVPDLLAASTHTPGPLEGKILGTIFVIVSVVVVVGYVAFEVRFRRDTRRRRRTDDATNVSDSE
jgi:threonine/homoserine/homoserine lactone efflux protein